MDEDVERRFVALEAQVKMLAMMVGRQGADYVATEGGSERGTSEDYRPVRLAMLTTKQHVALQMLIANRGNDEIARRFGVTCNGAKVYLRAIYKKFGVHTRSQAVVAVWDEWEKVGPRRYEALSKGVPKDWAATWLDRPIEDDPYRKLYEANQDGE